MRPNDPEATGREGAGAQELADRCSPLAREILSYMARNPDTPDTLEGIAGWRLPEHRIRTETSRVRKALSDLVEIGLVTREAPADGGGETRYRIHPRHRESAVDLLGGRETER